MTTFNLFDRASALGALDSDTISDTDGRALDAGFLRKQVAQSNLLLDTPFVCWKLQQSVAQDSANQIPRGRLATTQGVWRAIACGSGPWWPGQKQFEARITTATPQTSQTIEFIIDDPSPRQEPNHKVTMGPGFTAVTVRGEVRNEFAYEQDWVLRANIIRTNISPLPGVVVAAFSNPFFNGTLNGQRVTMQYRSMAASQDGLQGDIFTEAINTDPRPVEVLVRTLTTPAVEIFRRRITRLNDGRNLSFNRSLTEQEYERVRGNAPYECRIVQGGYIDLSGVTVLCGRSP